MRIRSPWPRKRTRIEIIPLIDIMFFLLASFMMVSIQMQKVQTVRASLPTATVARSDGQPDLINLSVDQYGRVTLDDEGRLGFPELRAALTNRLAANTNVPVFITGHPEATHGAMVYVLDYVRRAGVNQVAFAVRARE